MYDVVSISMFSWFFRLFRLVCARCALSVCDLRCARVDFESGHACYTFLLGTIPLFDLSPSSLRGHLPLLDFPQALLFLDHLELRQDLIL